MVRLDRTLADTARYYARARATKIAAAIAGVALIASLGVWQLPNAVTTVQSWAAAVSGRDDVLDAQIELSDALNAARDTIDDAPAPSATAVRGLSALVRECEEVRQLREPAPMRDCTVRLTAGVDAVAARP
jgi:hypothetical protein